VPFEKSTGQGRVLPETVRASSIDQVMSLNRTMDGQGRVIILFKGHLDEHILERAVALSFEAEPLLRYRFVEHSRRPYWRMVRTEDLEQAFHIFHCSSADRPFNDLMVRPVEAQGAPQVKVGLFREKNDVVCIRSNHMALDGGGAIRYLGLLSTIYRELQKDDTYRPRQDPISRPSPRLLFRDGGLIEAVAAIPKMTLPGAEWGLSRKSDDISEQSFIIRRLEGDRTRSLRVFAKEKGVTVNDVLLAAYFRALVKVLQPSHERPLRIEVPVNMRRALPEGSIGAISNLSAVYFLNLAPREEDFQATVHRVHDEIERQKVARVELAEMLMIELLLAPGRSFLKGMQELVDFNIAHPVLSNLGIIDPAVVDFGAAQVEDVQFIGPTLYPPNIGLGASTFRETMTLNMNCCGPAAGVDVMSGLLDLMIEELPR